jgi:cell division protein FtsZ
MVHRIQNRNPGYSDFSNMNAVQTNFSNPISEGATALKLDNEIQEEQTSVNEESLVLNNEVQDENILETEDVNISNGLENFHIEEDAPDLFNSESTDNADNTENEFESFTKAETSEEEDDLEIPAFLRRQKN